MRQQSAIRASIWLAALTMSATLLADGRLRAQENGAQAAASAEDTAGEKPGLGISVAGGTDQDGAVVMDVQPGSPAAKAGIRPGDRILAIGEQEVASPADLSAEIGKHQVGDQVDVRVSRDGSEQNLQATLAARSSLATPQEEAPSIPPDEGESDVPMADQPGSQSDQAAAPPRRGRQLAPPSGWLGVMLQDGDDEGAEITQLFPDGPADRAGLRQGDRILKIGDHDVASVEEAVEQFTRMKPGERVKLTIADSNGGQREVTVRLGDRQRAFEQQYGGFGQEFRGMPPTFAPGGEGQTPFFSGDTMREHQRRMDAHQERLERLTEELLEEVRALRQDVQQLRGGGGATEATTRPAPAPSSEDQPQKTDDNAQGTGAPGQ